MMSTPTQGGRARFSLNGAPPRLVSTIQLWWTYHATFFRNSPWELVVQFLFLNSFQSLQGLGRSQSERGGEGEETSWEGEKRRGMGEKRRRRAREGEEGNERGGERSERGGEGKRGMGGKGGGEEREGGREEEEERGE